MAEGGNHSFWPRAVSIAISREEHGPFLLKYEEFLRFWHIYPTDLAITSTPLPRTQP